MAQVASILFADVLAFNTLTARRSPTGWCQYGPHHEVNCTFGRNGLLLGAEGTTRLSVDSGGNRRA
jgi:hypothetical protein